MPIWIEVLGNDGGIVRPVFEQCLVRLIKTLQVLRTIPRAAREQDHVVRTGHGVDAVQLYEPKPVDQLMQITPSGSSRRLFGQRMPVEEQPSGLAIAKPCYCVTVQRRFSVSPNAMVGFSVTVFSTDSAGSARRLAIISAAFRPISSLHASIVANCRGNP